MARDLEVLERGGHVAVLEDPAGYRLYTGAGLGLGETVAIGGRTYRVIAT